MLWLLALGGLLLYAAFTLHLALLALGYPYQLDYGEGLVLHQARLLANGESIYKGIDSYPYIFSNYPPLVQAVVAPWLALAGVSFLPGRLLVLAVTLGLTAVLFALARRAGARRPAAAAAALLFLGSPYVYHWAPLFRIDLPALLLTTLGVLVLAAAPLHTEMTTRSSQRSALRTGGRHVAVAAVLFVLALYTKQSYIAAPAAAAVYLALNDRAALRRFLIVVLAAGVLPFLAIEAATSGAFSFGLFTANVNPFSLALLGEQLRSFVAAFAVIILLALIAVAGARPRHGLRDALRSVPLLGWYGLFAVATVLLAGKVGAWENYFFEALFALCLGTGLGLDMLLRSPRPAVQRLAPLMLLVQLALMWHDPRTGLRVMTEDGAANRALAPLIAAQRGMILSEDLGLLLVNGQEIPYFSFEYAQLARVGRWDQHWELDNLRAGRFALVVLEKGTREDPDRYQRFTREVLSAVDEAYSLVGEAGKYRVYTPAPLLRQTDASFADVITLRGFRLDEPPPAGAGIVVPDPAAALPSLNPYRAALRVTLLWQAEQQTPANYKVFVHLEDAAGVRVAQSDAVPLFGLYPTKRWQPGESVRDYHDLALPAGLPAGRYVLRAGLYDEATGQRVTLRDGRDSLVIAALPIGMDVAPAAAAPPHRFANGAALAGFALSSTAVSAGAPLSVTLRWQTERYLAEDYTVFVHLAQSDGRPVAQADGAPQNGVYPTSLWNPGELINDVHVLQAPASVAPGVYRLLVGLYHQPSETRLPLASGADSIDLGQVNIVR